MHPISWPAGLASLDPRSSALPLASAGGAEGSASAIGVRTQRATAIDITTAEGDRVTISSTIVDEIAAVTYDDTGRLSRSVSRSIAITIEGELSAEEMRDIRKVVKRLTHDNADHGNRLGALARQVGRAPLDSIASVDATSARTSVLVAGLLQTTVPPDVTPIDRLPPERVDA